MNQEQIILLIVYIMLGLFLSSFIVMIPIFFKIAYEIHKRTFTRPKDDYSRHCSDPSVPNHLQMYNDGFEFLNKHKENMIEVSIVSKDNLTLVGEFYNYGYENTVIIVPGRCECLEYSYYYSLAYENIKANILVIDQRACGHSGGIYLTAGIRESEDLLIWAKYLHEKYNQKGIMLHGICVGGCGSVLAITNKECPDYVKAILVDGLFESFTATVVTHTKYLGKPAFPVAYMVNYWFKRLANVNTRKLTPKKVIKTLTKPICFIHCKGDIFSLPKKAVAMYNSCPSKDKEFVWFSEGYHSHIRQYALEKYDAAVKTFFEKHFN